VHKKKVRAGRTERVGVGGCWPSESPSLAGMCPSQNDLRLVSVERHVTIVSSEMYLGKRRSSTR